MGPSLAISRERSRGNRSPRSAPPAGEQQGRTGRQQHGRGRRRGTGRSRAEVPDARKAAKSASDAVRRSTDVCALGKRYGGWRADSPQAVICERTYGR
ncbi:hypothetical protein [Streptomyces galbus]|uniref:Uncharacterized protein n=1 Tax=Streptomyces galbus TaxID=33898 RepID=A0ABX1IQI0_STRGB|nr:hypothetical protein [Streptomyces galbus]NKQ27809.1 hypothetical protein [Streptomyces galbus]